MPFGRQNFFSSTDAITIIPFFVNFRLISTICIPENISIFVYYVIHMIS